MQKVSVCYTVGLAQGPKTKIWTEHSIKLHVALFLLREDRRSNVRVDGLVHNIVFSKTSNFYLSIKWLKKVAQK